MYRPGPRSLRTQVAAACAVVVAAQVTAQTPGPGQAAGRFTVDGKSIAFAYAYAQLEPNSEGKDELWVLVTEKPASADRLAARTWDFAANGSLNAMAFALDAENLASDWVWKHPALAIGCGFCSALKFRVSSRTDGEIAGTAYSEEPQTWKTQKYEFRVSFRANIRRPWEVPGTTVAQRAAIRTLLQRRFFFTPGYFYTAVVTNEPELVRLFLDAGMKPDALDPGMSETALLYLARMDCTDAPAHGIPVSDALKLISMLIAAGADPNYRDPEGRVPLVAAYGCGKIVEALLKGGAKLSLASRDREVTVGREVMDAAIAFGHPDVVRVLIAHGYDVKRDGARLLENARREPEIQKILRAAGAAPAVPPARTPATVETPAKPPAGPEAKRAARAALSPDQARQELARRKMPFTQEAFWGRLTQYDTEGALLFLDAGMAPGVRRPPPQNDTPLQFVTSGGCGTPLPAQKAAAVEIALALIAHKADVNAKDDNDTTPLIHAAESCPADVVRALLRAGASTKAKARGGATAMMMAVLMDREDNVRALIEGGYDPSSELAGLLPIAAGKPTIEALLKQATAKKLR
jgi:ankyrin repeat protein